MRVGLALPHYGFSFADGRDPSFEDLARWARKAEGLGFDSVWVSDHFFYSFGRYGADPAPIGSLEPLTSLAALAVVTERVRLGTLVLCAPFRHPGLVAKMAATIDEASGGRLDLGVGAGWLQDEFDAFGYRFGSVGERFEALEETLRVVDQMRRGDRLLPRPPQRPMPLFVGGRGGPRLLGLAARYADGWNTVWRVSPEAYARKVDDVRAACERHGRDAATFRLSIGLYGLVGNDEAEARASFERGRASFPGGAMDADTWESWRADTLSGSPEQVLARIEALEALGVDELILSPWVLPFAVVEPEQVDRFADLVLGPLRS